jgi:uncharacterized protein YcsI (UPF0317 family)
MMSTIEFMSSEQPTVKSSVEARRLIRAGHWSGHTSGMSPNYVQGNVVILPKNDAEDFLLFCKKNPKPCPLLAVSKPGVPGIPELGSDLDIRTDVPSYRVWKNGLLLNELTDISELWRDDLVTFVIGCSFSFEQPLIDAGIPLRHVLQGKNVAMYKTNIPTNAVGIFQGPLVVSMRPMKPADAIKAIEITSKLNAVHGAPIHFGSPSDIGISNLATPDFGDAVEIKSGEVPVFWACGVTPQTVIMDAKPLFCITHTPGAMLITDLLESELKERC